MSKVLIVDDEKIIRIGLKMMIPWEQHGFELIGAAEDGEAAMALVEQYTPDIVITDLKMPRLNGLELIQKLKEAQFFSGKIIAISNYGEFDLVREAMKLGAIDYLLKVTLKPENLLDSMNNAANQLLSEKKKQELERQKEVAQIENLMLARTNFFKDLVYFSNMSESEVDRQAQKLNIQIDPKRNFLLLITIDEYVQTMNSGKWTQKHLLAFAISNIISEMVDVSFVMEFSEISERDYMVVLPDRNKYESATGKLQFANRIAKLLKLYLNLGVNVVISPSFASLQQVREAYRSCKEAVELRFYKHDAIVIQVGDAVFDGKKHMQHEQDNLLEHIQSGNKEAYLGCFDDMYEKAKQGRVPPAQFKKAISAVLDSCEAFNAESEHPLLPEQVREQLSRGDNLAEVREAFVQAVSYFSQNAIPVSSKYRKEIRAIIAYMLKHIDQKITLQMMASVVNMNESYLTRLFKKETGKTIVNFLNELRLEKGRELLKNPDLSIKEIAELVGIPDPFYFNRLFNKTYGLNPTDFKKNNLKSINRP
ncbi:AraC family transcriptional regulator [Paenibacillus marchantiophytorum]|uniref:AraC family transcriptional regulator n=1 Tax=Paenibacillus marchantiophytorum TaxID=1619310 RepID=A0ABQ1F7P7_9BACL|nr:response regulator [Paenibacillus marchantiophytorum]GGA02627.1 AraC family transcriptional regulator [Paenibacillus marchantiophytorum]